MEKLDITQICILCNEEIADGRIGEFFANKGIIQTYTGRLPGNYYFSDGRTVITSNKKPEFRKQINPWKKPRRKFPREMMVCWVKDLWFKRTVLGKVAGKYPFVTLHENQKPSDEGITHVHLWPYAKEIKTD